MADIVPADRIEEIVGAHRHPTRHFARAVSVERRVYILHSEICRESTPDLRTCPFSLALDRGIEHAAWPMDAATTVEVVGGLLVPVNATVCESCWLTLPCDCEADR